jgi:hypothetical protein
MGKADGEPSRAPLRLGIVVMSLAIIGLTVATYQNLHSVHTVPVGGQHALHLSPGNYQIYQDPGESPAPPEDFTLTGPNGRLSVEAQSGMLSPFDAAGPLLGIGLFIPAVSFEILKAGTYYVTVAPGYQTSNKVFLGESRQVATVRVLPWLMGLVTGMTLIVVGLARCRKSRHPLVYPPFPHQMGKKLGDTPESAGLAG